MAESKIKLMSTVQEIDDFQVGKGRRLNSATHEEILAGATSDIYFVKTQDILARLGRQDVQVTAEIFGRKPGLFVGINEALGLLADAPVEVWALPEGSEMSPKEVVCRIKGRYADFGVYETALLGIWPAAAVGPRRPAKLRRPARTSRFPALGRGIFTLRWLR